MTGTPDQRAFAQVPAYGERHAERLPSLIDDCAAAGLLQA